MHPAVIRAVGPLVGRLANPVVNHLGNQVVFRQLFLAQFLLASRQDGRPLSHPVDQLSLPPLPQRSHLVNRQVSRQANLRCNPRVNPVVFPLLPQGNRVVCHLVSPRGHSPPLQCQPQAIRLMHLPECRMCLCVWELTYQWASLKQFICTTQHQRMPWSLASLNLLGFRTMMSPTTKTPQTCVLCLTSMSKSRPQPVMRRALRTGSSPVYPFLILPSENLYFVSLSFVPSISFSMLHVFLMSICAVPSYQYTVPELTLELQTRLSNAMDSNAFTVEILGAVVNDLYMHRLTSQPYVLFYSFRNFTMPLFSKLMTSKTLF